MATQPPAPGTGLTVFDPQAGAPAHVAHFFEEAGTNIQPKLSVDSLSPQGKSWTLVVSGQKSPLQRRNVDGDLEPMPIMKVVILDYAKQRGRAYYEGDYDPNKESAPICWSDDGVAPHASLPGPFAAGTEVEPGKARKISAACATCPMAVKGSKVDGAGRAKTACGVHKMLAVLPDPAMGLPEALRKPLRLKIAITSIWDEQSPDEAQQGWLAFDKYVDWLLSRNVQHTAALVTKMKFDPNATYPKIFFNAERYLDAQELGVIGPMSKSDEVKKLLGGTWTPAGVDGVPIDQQEVAEPKPAIEQTISPPAAGYVMAVGEKYTREQYHASGWTDQQLLDAKKMTVGAASQPAAAAAPAAPAPVAVVVEPVVAQPEPAPVVAQAVVVGEPAVVAAAPTATAAVVSPPATEAVVVAGAPSSPAVVAPADPPVQGAAQAEAPIPAPAPAAPEPPAAAAAAAEAAPAVSTNVSPELETLMKEWA